MRKFAGGENKHGSSKGSRSEIVCRGAGGLESHSGERGWETTGEKRSQSPGWVGEGRTYDRSKSRDGEHQGGSCDGVGGHHSEPLLCAQALSQMLYPRPLFHSS